MTDSNSSLRELTDSKSTLMSLTGTQSAFGKPTDGKSKQIKLTDVPAREVAGRDAMSRFHLQFKATTIAVLTILDGGDTDRIYCDYQDDFVVREVISGQHKYVFCQVKTNKKSNHLWSTRQIFGLYKTAKKAKIEDIRDSFYGKLISHTINFKDSCKEVRFITNINFDDSVLNVIEAISTDDINNKKLKELIDGFDEAITNSQGIDTSEVLNCLKKLKLLPNVPYLSMEDDENFQSIAAGKIYKYSEIDLEYSEYKTIIDEIMALVHEKSFTRLLEDVSESELDNKSGIGIEELLDVLSLSKNAYYHLKNGGDPKAIKSLSIMQRKLKSLDVSEEMIDFCSKAKVEWDKWTRDNRLKISDMDYNFLIDDLNKVLKSWIKKEISFRGIKAKVIEIKDSVEKEGAITNLSEEILFGGVFSVLIRKES